DLEIRGQRRFDPIQSRHDRVDDGDGVGPGLLSDLQGNRRPAVDSRDLAYLLYGILNFPNIAESDHRSILLRQDDLTEIAKIRKPSHGAESNFRRAGDEISSRNFNVLTLNRIADLIGRQAIRRKPVGVQQ